MKIVILDKKTLGDDLDISEASKFGEVIVRDNTAPEEVEAAISDADSPAFTTIVLVSELYFDITGSPKTS